MRHPLPHPHRYRTAVRYITAEYLRNRTALFLLVVFVPLWCELMVATMPHDPVSFRFRPTGGFLSVDSQGISVLTAGLNAITLIVGFLIFSTTKRGISFDHRLVLCGYPQRILLAAKLTAMAVATCAVTGYATLVLLLFYHHQSPAVFTDFSYLGSGFGNQAGVFRIELEIHIAGQLGTRGNFQLVGVRVRRNGRFAQIVGGLALHHLAEFGFRNLIPPDL